MSVEFETGTLGASKAKTLTSSRRTKSGHDVRHSALEQLRALLAAKAIRVSGRLPPERTLADKFGVSRRAIRHALDQLEAEGRIIRQQGRGTMICNASAGPIDLGVQLANLTNPVDTLEARLALEPSLARLAALRGTQADFDKLFEAAEASRVATDPIAYEQADAAFHRRVATAARNPLLLKIFEAVLLVASDRSWRHGRETAHCVNNQARYAEAHRRIATAIASRNSNSAEESMRMHLGMVQQQLIEHAFPRPSA